MDALLDRLKRERRWTVAIFLVAAALITGVRFAFAPPSAEPGAAPSEAAAEVIP